ncbi:2-dehydropantoate 2-reductase [bacterium]|nr:2-dehydropantoate 2-reductase [bacterium]
MGKKTILCIGMGAVGCLYMSHCDPDKTRVFGVSRSDADVMEEQGISILDPVGKRRVWHPERVFSSLEEVCCVPDYVVIATKAIPDTLSLDALRLILAPKSVLVLIQNGLYIEEPYLNAFPDHELLSALAFVCVTKTAPAQIHHQDFGRLVIGPYPQGDSEQAVQFASFFDQSGLSCKLSSDILYQRYKKLMWNAAFNCLSVIHEGLTTQALLVDPLIEARIFRIMKEVQQVARVAGCRIDDRVIEAHISDTKKMIDYKPSMCLDWEANRPLETEAILGNVVRYAERHGVEVPELGELYGFF